MTAAKTKRPMARAVAAKAKLTLKPKKPIVKIQTKAPASLKGIKAVAISLEKRPDRWAKVQHSVAKAAPWLTFNRMLAVDGKKEPPSLKEVTKSWSTARLATLFHWYKSVKVPMSPGERGCCGSHIKAWRIAAKSSKPLVVLEDDAVALPAFTSSLAQAVKEAPKDTGMIFLSSKDRGYPKPAGKVLMKPDFIWTTVGYLIWPAAARALLKRLPVDAPVDNFLALLIKDGDIKAYSMKPAGVRQANTWNVGSDVPHSDDIAH